MLPLELVQLTSREERSISLEVTQDEAATLRRLNIILSVKDAYIKAIGQPVGFDYSRIECDVPSKSMTVDGQSLAGWHIRLFAVNLAPTPELVSHKSPLHYQVAVAVFRGGHGMKFSFAKSTEDLASFVTFFDVREVVDAVPRLGEYDNAALPPTDKIPLSGKNSIASIAISEKEKERLREKDKKDIPAVPALPQNLPLKYASDVKHQPSYQKVDVKGSIPPSSKSSHNYPPDLKYQVPPSSTNTYPIPQPQYMAKQAVPSGPAPAYTASAKPPHPHTHSTNGYGSYPHSHSHHQPQSNPIHTARR